MGRGRDSAKALAALVLGACAATGAPPAGVDPQLGCSMPLQPPPSAALAWPEPLPPAAADVPTLFKGLIVGSWTPDAPGDFEQAWVDEAGLRSVKGGEQASRRVWRGFATAEPAVPVSHLAPERDGEAVAYLYSLLMRATLPADQQLDAAAVLHVRHRGRLRAWFDGRQVLDAPAPPGDGWGEARVPVTLTGAYDVLLLKCGSGSAAFGTSPDVEVRVSAADGSALPGVTWNSMRPGGIPTDL
jgi:hypothetical protein